MTDHGYYEELITAGLDGELSEDQARELRAHLETCERCRHLLITVNIRGYRHKVCKRQAHKTTV